MYELYAQGDLLIERVEFTDPPRELVEPSPDGLTVLAEGEVTGHRHAIHEAVTFFRDDNLARDVPRALYVGHVTVPAASGPVMLRHEEHDAIELTPGTYRVRRQRQVEPSDVEIVMD